ncbi:MAG: hypothetical protein ACE5JF_13110 [Anaerolineales bacterium]
MNRATCRALAAIALAFALGACSNGDDLPVNVASLRESLPEMQRAATQWRTDAYMVHASVELLSGNPYRSQATGYFQSPSTDFEGVLIYLEQDGSIAAEVVPHEIQVRQVDPITGDDWKLDAQEALAGGLTAEGRQYLEENSDSQCSFMYLERDVPGSPERVVWRVGLGGCLLDPPFQSIVIDANTGEIVRQRTY